jgi:hypothetical protein
MKLDMDFLRDLLLQIEAGRTVFETASAEVAAILRHVPEKPLSQEEADKLSGHLDLLENAGFIEIEGRMGGGAALVKCLTWRGYEFLKDVRDPDVWRKTKERAKTVTNISVGFLWEIVKAEIKIKLGLP